MFRCELCPAHRRADATLWSGGKPYADIFLIGDRPGPADAVTGRLFSERNTYDTLIKGLQVADIPLQDVWFTLLFRCMERDNDARSPLDFMDKCWQHVLAEIAEYKPVVLVLLGSRTAEYVLHRHLGFQQIARNRPAAGTVAGQRVWLYHTLHPRLAYRRSFRAPEVLDDFKQLGLFIKRLRQ